MVLLQNTTRRRRAFSALACVLAGLQLGAFFHVAVGEHVLCAEHGEWVDAHSDASPDAVVAHAGEEAQVRAGAALAAAGEHQHCSAFFHRRGSTPPGSARAEAPIVQSCDAVGAVVAFAPHRSVLFVAPKQSPPARA
jgi:hypothetical protein